MDQAIQDAREAGRLKGNDAKSFGADCPFDHKRLAERLAWFEGFGEGRAQLASGAPEGPRGSRYGMRLPDDDPEASQHG